MRPLLIASALLFAALGLADTVTLRNGGQIQGTFVGGSARQIRIDVGDHVQNVNIDDIVRIEFNTPEAAQPAPVTPPPPPQAGGPPREDFAPQRAGIELPAGTNLVVRMIDGVDSQVNRIGQTFAASMDEPVIVNGESVIPRGADVVVKLTDSKESGKIAGRSELTLDLVSVRINGRMVDLNTQTITRDSSSRGARTAKVAGGTAALGAIIGAIAGGGKGAAIGAGAGAAAGAGAEVVTKGQRVKIPSETRLTFALETAVRI